MHYAYGFLKILSQTNIRIFACHCASSGFDPPDGGGVTGGDR